jgi:hypothetical protein
MYVVFTENEIYAFDATDQQLIDFAGNLSFLQQYLIYERMRCPSLSRRGAGGLLLGVKCRGSRDWLRFSAAASAAFNRGRGPCCDIWTQKPEIGILRQSRGGIRVGAGRWRARPGRALEIGAYAAADD